jgi:hypothetical protein
LWRLWGASFSFVDRDNNVFGSQTDLDAPQGTSDRQRNSARSSKLAKKLFLNLAEAALESVGLLNQQFVAVISKMLCSEECLTYKAPSFEM